MIIVTVGSIANSNGISAQAAANVGIRTITEASNLHPFHAQDLACVGRSSRISPTSAAILSNATRRGCRSVNRCVSSSKSQRVGPRYRASRQSYATRLLIARCMRHDRFRGGNRNGRLIEEMLIEARLERHASKVPSLGRGLGKIVSSAVNASANHAS